MMVADCRRVRRSSGNRAWFVIHPPGLSSAVAPGERETVCTVSFAVGAARRIVITAVAGGARSGKAASSRSKHRGGVPCFSAERAALLGASSDGRGVGSIAPHVVEKARMYCENCESARSAAQPPPGPERPSPPAPDVIPPPRPDIQPPSGPERPAPSPGPDIPPIAPPGPQDVPPPVAGQSGRIAHTPHDLVTQHRQTAPSVVDQLSMRKQPMVPA